LSAEGEAHSLRGYGQDLDFAGLNPPV